MARRLRTYVTLRPTISYSCNSRPLVKAKSSKTKRRPKKPRTVDLAPTPIPKTHPVRVQALADFVTDPEGRDARYHYTRLDRTYRDHVSIDVFLHWHTEDEWEIQREAYWTEAQRQLLEKTRTSTVQNLVDQVNDLQEVRDLAKEWCEPLYDDNGEVLRYPVRDDKGQVHRYAGKPMLALRPSTFERGVAAFIALEEALQARRDAILRLTNQGENAAREEHLAEPVIRNVELSPGDIRMLAQELTKRRQPELVEYANEDDDAAE